jgi:hypothetical protein
MCDDSLEPNGMTKLEVAIAFCGLYEAELLASLILSHWGHPRGSDEEFAKELVEDVAEILSRSQHGDQFFEDIKPDDVNFVAALWYAESARVTDIGEAVLQERRDWLTKVRRALPSCFCDPEDLA